ncbi:MAG: hypothetical protein MHPSP_001284 [Paramarteilia canceri]
MSDPVHLAYDPFINSYYCSHTDANAFLICSLGLFCLINFEITYKETEIGTKFKTNIISNNIIENRDLPLYSSKIRGAALNHDNHLLAVYSDTKVELFCIKQEKEYYIKSYFTYFYRYLWKIYCLDNKYLKALKCIPKENIEAKKCLEIKLGDINFELGNIKDSLEYFERGEADFKYVVSKFNKKVQTDSFLEYLIRTLDNTSHTNLFSNFFLIVENYAQQLDKKTENSSFLIDIDQILNKKNINDMIVILEESDLEKLQNLLFSNGLIDILVKISYIRKDFTKTVQMLLPDKHARYLISMADDLDHESLDYLVKSKIWKVYKHLPDETNKFLLRNVEKIDITELFSQLENEYFDTNINNLILELIKGLIDKNIKDNEYILAKWLIVVSLSISDEVSAKNLIFLNKKLPNISIVTLQHNLKDKILESGYSLVLNIFNFFRGEITDSMFKLYEIDKSIAIELINTINDPQRQTQSFKHLFTFQNNKPGDIKYLFDNIPTLKQLDISDILNLLPEEIMLEEISDFLKEKLTEKMNYFADLMRKNKKYDESIASFYDTINSLESENITPIPSDEPICAICQRDKNNEGDLASSMFTFCLCQHTYHSECAIHVIENNTKMKVKSDEQIQAEKYVNILEYVSENCTLCDKIFF